MSSLLAVSRAIDALLRTVAHLGAWFFIACIVTICFDVVTRKFGFQLNIAGYDLGSTRLQELEWHFHGALFLTWLGYAYVKNAHVRIDILTGGLPARKQAWFELLGCLIFALPYLYVALPFAWDFVALSFAQNESSSAPTGLPKRWIIKAFLFYGFVSVFLAVVSVMIRRFVYLFGSPEDAELAMPGGVAGSAH
jgi:TRAP-type mannitol/chloroaromatic compound transport system permease small subunit